MTTWADLAQSVLDAMEGSGVTVTRSLIAPGSAAGRRCRQFLVFPELLSPAPQTFQSIPRKVCTVIPTLGVRAVFTADCAPTPGDDGSQPDAAKTTVWALQFLTDAEKVWGAILDALGDDCDGVLIGTAQFTGPAGGVASMSVPIGLSPTT